MSRSYIVVAAVVLVAMGIQTANRQWSNDWYLHAATVRELAAHPLHPHHPTIGTSTADPEFSPYLLLLGIIVKMTGRSVVSVMSVAALINAGLFLVAFRLFVRRLTTTPRAPTWALVFVLVLWGVDPWRWSGYPNLNAIGFGLPYPSMMALVLLLFGLVTLDAWCARPRLGIAIGAAIIGSSAALIHPPTVPVGAAAAGAILVSRWRRALTHYWWHLAIAAGVAAAIIGAWPLYPWYSLAAHSGVYDVENRITYEHLLPRLSLLLIVGVPVLFVRWLRSHRDPLVLLFLGGLAVFALGRVAGRETLGRALPVAAIGGQVAVADCVARRVDTGERRYFYAGVAVALAGVIGSVAALPRFVPRPLLPVGLRDRPELQAITEGYEFLAVVPTDDVVAAQRTLTSVEPAFGGKVIAPGFPAAFVDDASRRVRDNDELFSTTDSSRRAELLRRYDVRWLLVERSYADDPSNAPTMVLGRVVHRDSRVVLVQLP